MNKKTIHSIFKAVGLAMGVSTLVLSIMKALDTDVAITLLSLGLTCLGISQLNSIN
ncbi:MAG: hypothetical protein E6469_08660 [Clostridium perfringens]|uniref:Uncharacterized protein n=1 Tax=Clostridium perfringens TaxID=1502 RepID=A0A411AM88_CLOPF|nr:MULTISPECIES: hypothetical protein [Clostridium]MDU3584199.1 hypothetical protein [Clostridium butyricum]MDU4214641.1 hypothetical protein [Veillonella sp.]EGT0681892.1 hypothetical protein [Clostridium perfringens]EGT0684710.1 hypothetical protein [Clostridium perfringens]EGT0686680.1 hypothetical protein [Clostridium perfringens]